MKVEPFISVGNLYFNDTRSVIRLKLNEDFEEGLKEFDGIKDYYDYFLDSDLFVYYNSQDKVVAFEFFSGSVIYNGVSLLETPYSKLVDLFLTVDTALQIEETGFTSNSFGIGVEAVYASRENPVAFAESLIVFEKGYYDS